MTEHNPPDAYGLGIPLPSKREMYRARREAFKREYPLPDRDPDNPLRWELAMGSRMAYYLKSKGIINNSIINTIRDAVLAESRLRKIFDDRIWYIVKRHVRQRKPLKRLENEPRHKRLELMLQKVGMLSIAHMSEFRQFVADFKTDKEAVRWCKNFIKQYKDKDIDTAASGMKAYAIKPPAPVPPSLHLKTDNNDTPPALPQTESIPERMERLKKENPVSDTLKSIAEQEDSLDAWFPRGDEPEDDNPPTQPVKPNHRKPCKNDWLPDPEKQRKFYALAGEIYDFHDVPSKQRGGITHRAAGGVTTLYDYAGTANDLIKAIKGICVAEFPVDEKSNEKADFSQDTKSEPTTPENQNKLIVPNSTRGNGQPKGDKPVQEIDKKSEIRERYNKPRNGNDYLMVQGRVVIFRLEHPDWTIETEHILLTEQTAVYKATIRNPEGRVIATGHGRATETGTKHLGGRYIEKAETAAIGRALALAGFGTDDTLDDEDYLADSPVKAG